MSEIIRFKRESGVVMPIFSLPSPYGIGTFGKSAYDFVDQLVKAGQRYWQILPLGHTGFGDSPYQTFSIIAGNPFFIDLDMLVEDLNDKYYIDWINDIKFEAENELEEVSEKLEEERKREEMQQEYLYESSVI